jgi:uncharacterized protein YndB with AHSA1/START domain
VNVRGYSCIFNGNTAMATGSGKTRIDCASRVVRASPRAIYQAYMDPDALVSWLPPAGMKGRIDAFDPHVGGSYRMELTYTQPDHSAPGKTSGRSDIVRGQFLELVPGKRIVQEIEFESEDPRYSGKMKITWSLTVVPRGTDVSICCENVPDAIRREDHEAGLKSTLENLATFTE